MSEEQAEHSFLGKHKYKMWTYLILMVLLIGIVLVDQPRVEEPGARRARASSTSSGCRLGARDDHVPRRCDRVLGRPQGRDRLARGARRVPDLGLGRGVRVHRRLEALRCRRLVVLPYLIPLVGVRAVAHVWDEEQRLRSMGEGPRAGRCSSRVDRRITAAMPTRRRWRHDGMVDCDAADRRAVRARHGEGHGDATRRRAVQCCAQLHVVFIDVDSTATRPRSPMACGKAQADVFPGASVTAVCERTTGTTDIAVTVQDVEPGDDHHARRRVLLQRHEGRGLRRPPGTFKISYPGGDRRDELHVYDPCGDVGHERRRTTSRCR